MLNPLWFNQVRHGSHSAVVTADGAGVELQGVPLRFRDSSSLPPGSAVAVWIDGNGHFVCARVRDIEARDAARKADELARAEAARKRANANRVAADAFNAALRIPVPFEVGIKNRLSGLSEQSYGDGRNVATVEHVFLLEPLSEGRLSRSAGDFLCTALNGTNGKQWSANVVDHRVDGDGNLYRPMVTCKACLTVARRWQSGQK